MNKPPEILTFGCRLNTYESEVMRGHAAGLDDVIIVNTCAVTAEAERQARQAIRRAHRDRPACSAIARSWKRQAGRRRRWGKGVRYPTSWRRPKRCRIW